jgi:putative colanic acid biosynthesis acetyltransferase WcaF
MQKLEQSIHPWTWREKSRRAAWQVTWRILGAWGPRWFSPFRILLLRAFVARVGRACLLCGGVKILMPWNLEMGDFVAIAEGVNIYNFALTKIGSRTCISQRVWLCTGTHDYRKANFPLLWRPITIGESAWIAAETFVHPGTNVGAGTVVGARSVISGDLADWTVYAGNPACAIKRRDSFEARKPPDS